MAETFKDISRADLYAAAPLELLGSTYAEEQALNTFPGQAGATSIKHVLIVGFGFFLVAAIITLVTVSLHLSNTGFEVALS